ncbi:MAG TPA: nucleotidyltransferase domain-containing protein [Actinomycetota bacterium]|nr:nucleotidyltransferase domain-containing protein [Actinomycetota bacterium]
MLPTLPGVRRVSLFGSYARGSADLFTDLDVLVVQETDEPFVARHRSLYRALALPVDLDLICYTPQEFVALRDRPFLREILRQEVVLYEVAAS